MPVPGHGLGEAIRDRLRRAAAPRTRTAKSAGAQRPDVVPPE
jgi:hypothetical protein